MNLRRQLLFVSLATLALPWAGCQALRQMDDALAQGQARAQAATGDAIAARLASAQTLLLPDERRLSATPGQQLFAGALPHPPLLDGYGDEWRNWRIPAREFQAGGNPMARVALGRADDHRLYLLLTVADDTPTFHNPMRTGIANGDYVELHSGARRFRLPLKPNGQAEVWRESWQAAPQWRRNYSLRGEWTSNAGGYQLELGLPAEFGAGGFGIRIIDRTDNSSAPTRIASSFHTDSPGLLVEPLPALATELKHFLRPGIALTVVDHEGFPLAQSGRIGTDTEGPAGNWLQRWFYLRLLGRNRLPALPDSFPETLTRNKQVAIDWYLGADASRVAGVSTPIITRADEIAERPLLGRVIVAQSGTDWQSSAGETARRIWLTTLAAVAAVLLALLGYASWLSWRIRRLSRAAETALDSSGRLRSDFPRARLDDEIGSLNNAFAQLLGELDQHHQYLRTLASKLSHELRTPLAIVRSSLDNLESTNLPASARDYARRASEGSQRLSGILNALSGAQQLEAGIASAEKEDFDLGDLLDVLASSYADSQPRHHIALQRPAGPLPAHGAPELVAQLLDKLIDNACSFAPPGSSIDLSAERVPGHYRIAVSNPGPPLPEGFGQQIFDSLVSVRPDVPGRLHLGLGLHIARLICEFHGGRLEARNRADGSGAIFAFLLPD